MRTDARPLGAVAGGDDAERRTGRPGISIVVPAYNEESYLPGTLASVDAARRCFELELALPTEVIVVNNDSTDATKAVAESLGALVIDHSVRNIASVRNAGIRGASFDVVVTVDADSRIPEDAYVTIWRVMETGKYVGGGVRVAIETNKGLLRAIVFLMSWISRLLSGISGGMFFFSAAAARKIGGFPEACLIAEDVAFAKGLRRYGKSVGLEFKNLFDVTVRTLDRKEATFGDTMTAISQAMRQGLGRELSRKDLGYWYDPDR